MDRARRRAFEALNYRLRTLAGGRLAGLCRPSWIDILLTERCQARCVHCDIWRNKGREESPTPEQWKAALSGLRSWLGPMRVALTGGEALLKPHAVELAAHGSRIGLLIEFLTNGYWKDQRRIEALARTNPWRITLSLDGIGSTHDRVRGREGFFDQTSTTIETLKRIRREERLDFSIRLKTVLMSHNLDDACELAWFASQDGMDILYQPIEQNYNSPEDAQWYMHSENWPRDPERAVAVVEELKQLRRDGLSIANSETQLDVMVPYFRDPESLRIATQNHTAHDARTRCSALELFQVQANGDVKVCSHADPVGNIMYASPREIWASRPRWWESGCCLERRSEAAI